MKVNADSSPELRLGWRLRHIPPLPYFESAKLCGRLVGTATKEAVFNPLPPITAAAPANLRSDFAPYEQTPL